MNTRMIRPKESPASDRPWPPEQGEWTYEDWLQLRDDAYRYEVIDGELHMSPPPSTRQQRVLARLSGRLTEFLRAQTVGEILFAPVGVRLPNQSVPVQPDLLFIRKERLDIIGEEYVEGAPDLVVEVLSPSNWIYDRREKMRVYQEAGVAEYWIIDPRVNTVEVYVLEQNTYLLVGRYVAGETAPSHVLNGFEIAIDEVFS